MNIDKTNWLILEQLQLNARMPLTELSKKVGLSSPSVAERIQKMEDAGIINRYEVKLGMEAIGYPMGVFISAKIRFGQVEKFHEFIKTKPEITECYKLTGNDCLMMKANVRNTKHLEELNSTLSHFGELTTSLILSAVVDRRVYNSDF
ncbi:Lrp/AsnC family transcriptional regulator [Jejuia spongiicola]|uniref:Lrp/AsnC family transcriptional regulator n=1 Tax=Jejuia spongiicola TaxID=2942207 RepID=A0ABT0QGC4_9FLAO|nr:Lrp/AsnC family transcriptional regulator [Jejuia spongiicola]MCL6296042.1 Lrp/AsnC family transcriptional regulator [Jejuia spongiicola]